FFGQALLHRFGVVSQTVEPLSYTLLTGQFLVCIAFLGKELTTHFPCRQAGIEPSVAKLRIGLALPVHDLLDVVLQMGQAGFGRFASAPLEGITTSDAGSHLVGSL